MGTGSEFSGVRIDELNLYILRDVERTENCAADDMLRGLLCLVTPPEHAPNDLLKSHIEGVLDICNKPDLHIQGKEHASEIKVYLKECATSDLKKGMYDPFVKGCNLALDYLKNVAIPGAPPSSQAMNICFQHNDATCITQEHKGNISDRKPDVIILCPEHASGPATTPRKGRGARKEINPPSQWCDVLSSIEFKRSESKDAVSLPERPFAYTPVPNSTKPQYILDLSPDLPTSDYSPEASEGTTSGQASGSQNTRGQKRKTEATTSQEVEKKRRLNSNNFFDHIACQSAFYAAESFAENLATTRVINFVVLGSVIYIWYYDRQGIIQSSGIDYLEDLPRFLVLLYALERMGDEAYGRHPSFEPNIKEEKKQRKVESYRLEVIIEGKRVKLDLNSSSEACVTHYGLQSRATNVIPVINPEAIISGPRDEAGYVAKIFWPEEQRKDEVEILQRVKEIANEHPEVNGHVPEVAWHCVFGEDSTFAIRNALGIPNSKQRSRHLRVIVFPRLRPITELKEDELLRVWKDCILCHRELWKQGVHHRDVSSGNLMYRRVNGEVQGVLIDFDFASLVTSDALQGKNERTGTTPFMALDLLTQKAIDGEVKHIYRHDLESFVWTLVWLLLRYENGKLRSARNRKLDDWARASAIDCGNLKLRFLQRFSDYFPPDSSGASKLAGNCLLLMKLMDTWMSYRQALMESGDMTDDEVFGLYNKVVFEGANPSSVFGLYNKGSF